ncbi:hypothetical protein TKK_0018122 [Trichogramma kaykai]|uniref:Lipase n=1 Tax=Trichogramma kaykai TaxID=54128 RepID=A0ABD2W0B7_9HYME
MSLAAVLLVLIQYLLGTSESLFTPGLAARTFASSFQGNGYNFVATKAPGAYSNVSPAKMILRDGYPSETHSVTTEDGYILTVFRIPGSVHSPPVFLQHGLLESSADWLISGKNKSLAYILSDNGYDVWIGNARGNTFSRKHRYLSPNDPRYWNFTWSELGKYDHPAVFTHISKINGQPLVYIGHSMAGSTFSVMAIERPDIARKFKAFIGLAPATYEYHVRAPLRYLAPFWRQFQQMCYKLGIYEFLPHAKIFNVLAKHICQQSQLQEALCTNPLFLIGGPNPTQLNTTLLPHIWSSFPAGTSVKLFTHWLQQMVVNEFSKFDYGPAKNQEVYGTARPPKYDLSKVQVPSAVFWSKNDWLVPGEDVRHFYEQLPLKMGIYKVQDSTYNHFDFLWAPSAPEMVYSKILALLDRLDLRNNQLYY